MSELSANVHRLGQLADSFGLNEVEAAEYVLDHHAGFEEEFVKFCEEYATNGGNFNGF